LVEHPAGPAFGRYPFHVTIELSVDAVRAESFSQSQHTFLVLWGVVAVTDENAVSRTVKVAFLRIASSITRYIRRNAYLLLKIRPSIIKPEAELNGTKQNSVV
jgi:hypothetical protein